MKKDESTPRIRIIQIGDVGTGKKSVRRKFNGIDITKTFYDEIHMLGVIYNFINYNKNFKSYTFVLWNIIMNFKEEKFLKKTLKSFFQQKTDIILGFLDSTNITKESFDDLIKIIKFGWEIANAKVPVIFIATKSDLLTDKNKNNVINDFDHLLSMFVKNEKIKKNFIFTSAKTGENIDKCLELIADVYTTECVK